MCRQEQTVGQIGQLIVVSQMIEVLLFFQQARLELATQCHITRDVGQDTPVAELDAVAGDLGVDLLSVAGLLFDADRYAWIRVAQAPHQRFGLLFTGKQLGEGQGLEIDITQSEVAAEHGVGGDDPQTVRIDQQAALGRLLEGAA